MKFYQKKLGGLDRAKYHIKEALRELVAVQKHEFEHAVDPSLNEISQIREILDEGLRSLEALIEAVEVEVLADTEDK